MHVRVLACIGYPSATLQDLKPPWKRKNFIHIVTVITWATRRVIVSGKVSEKLGDAVNCLLGRCPCSHRMQGSGLLLQGVQDRLHLVHQVEAGAQLFDSPASKASLGISMLRYLLYETSPGSTCNLKARQHDSSMRILRHHLDH